MELIKQFIEDELMDEASYQMILDFITLPNFRSGEYEGNRYVIRKVNKTYIQIEDEVAFEHTGVRQVESFTPEQLKGSLTKWKNGERTSE